jgi:ABC-2 type transport system permease protein
MNWTAYWALVRRDLKLFFKDRRAVLMTMVAPILIGSFFGYLFGGVPGSGETSRVPVALIDEDQSAASKRLATSIAGDKLLELRQVDPAQAREQVRTGKITVVVVVPKGFGDQAVRSFFRAANKPEIQMMYDPSHGAELAMVRGVMTQHVMESVSAEAFGSGSSKYLDDSMREVESAEGMKPADRAALKQLLGSVRQWNTLQKGDSAAGGGPVSGLSMPYTVREEAITAKKDAPYNPYGHTFGGMSVQFILMMGMEAGLTMILHRRTGLWKRLRAAPLSRFVLISSRVTSAAIDSVIVLFVVFGFARLVFKVGVDGSLAGFIGVSVAFGLTTAAFGLLVAVSGKTVEATRAIAILTTLMMVMLGGAWIPAFLFPAWLQKITFLLPTRWAVDALDAMTWRGLGFEAAVAPIAALLGFAILFGGFAIWRFRWDTAD